MSAVRYIFRQNELTPQISAPGGLLVEDAVREAERNLASVRDESIAEVDRNIALLARSAAAVAADPGNLSAREEVYAHANVIAGLAGCCGLSEVGRVAFHLCDLWDLYHVSNTWNADKVAIYLSAIAVLRSPDISGAPEIRRSIVDGLHEISEHVRRSLADVSSLARQAPKIPG